MSRIIILTYIPIIYFNHCIDSIVEVAKGANQNTNPSANIPPNGHRHGFIYFGKETTVGKPRQ